MKTSALQIGLLPTSLACAAQAAPEGASAAYQVDGKPYEGFYIAPGKPAGLVLLVHDWDGVGDYGIPHEMTTYGGAPHAFTVFGTDRYREAADKASWSRFLDYLAATLKP